MVLPVIRVEVEADTREAEQGLERVERSMDGVSDAARRAGRSSSRLDGGLRQTTRRSGALRASMQNASFQVADLATQLELGVDPARAFSQQGSQLLGAFGPLGAILGAVVAVAVPLASAMGGLAANGENVTRVFGTLEPLATAISDAFTRLGPIVIGAAEAIVNNIDRILVIAGTAAAFFAGRWVAAFVVARVATFSLSASLIALRGALIRTGIGALIVGAGELAFQFSRLAQASGGVGNAVGLLFDVVRETFQRIGLQIEFLSNGFSQLGRSMQLFFLQALFNMSSSFVEFTQTVAQGLNNLFGTSLEGLSQNPLREAFVSPILEAQSALDGLVAREGDLRVALDAPFESIQKIRDLLASIKEEGLSLPDLLGGSDDDDETGKDLDEKLSEQEQRIRDHFDRVKAITQGGLSDQLGGYGNYFNSLVSLTNSNNSRLLSIGKAFAAAQALIDAWSAHNRVLADPTLPWFARIASAAQVLASGLGAVNAIRSVGSGGGGGAAGGGAGTAAGGGGGGGPAPLNVRVAGLDPNALFSGASIGGLLERLQDEAGDRGLTLTVAQ